MRSILRAPGVIAESCAEVTGSGELDGKAYHWEFSRMYGPTFTDAEGEFLAKQPGPRSKAWKCWQAWFDQLEQDSIDGSRLSQSRGGSQS